jgi:multidrug efflux pump subunit AcrA (membrane-fusion protein)
MHDLLQQLMPVLIFGAWIVISIYTANQKRKKKQQMQQRQYEMARQQKTEQASRPIPEQSRAQDNSCPSDAKDDINSDLKETLESIFGKSEPQVEEPTPPPPNTPEPVVLMDTKPEDQITEAQLLQEQAALQQRYSTIMVQSDAIAQSALASSGQSVTATEVTFSEDKLEFSSKELRKGIIWAEILGKPVSMRT